MANLKRPELKLGGNMSENFKNFELRFHDYCIQADYRNLAKNPETERGDYYKKPLQEISALRSAMPDEALQVIRYTIEPQTPADDRKKPWLWMDKLRLHYTGSIGSSLLADRFKFITCHNEILMSVPWFKFVIGLNLFKPVRFLFPFISDNDNEYETMKK